MQSPSLSSDGDVTALADHMILSSRESQQENTAKSAVHRKHFHIFKSMHLLPVDGGQVVSTCTLNSSFKYFEIDDSISYIGFADDFGPMNMASIFQFCELLDSQVDSHDGDVAFITKDDLKTMTNAIFLLGSYLIMKLDYDLARTAACFKDLMHFAIQYRDVSPGIQNFDLHIEDCWAGLLRGKRLGWASFEPDGFDLEEYQHYDNTLNADLHEVVPGKFVAMRGPRDLTTSGDWEDVRGSDGRFSHRDFSPLHYADILPQFDVRCVVRLNAPQYSLRALAASGIALADLFFEDCTPWTWSPSSSPSPSPSAAPWRCTARRAWAAPARSSRST